MRKEYTEAGCRAALTKMGCKFSNLNTFTVPKGRIGITGLGMVDFLSNYCRMIPKFI